MTQVAPPPKRPPGPPEHILRQQLNDRKKHLLDKYAAAKDDWFAKRETICEYLDLLDGGVLLRDLKQALIFVDDDKKHPLIHMDAPPLDLTMGTRSNIEAYAAALLEWGIEEKFAQQGVLADKIAKILAESIGCRRSTWGTQARDRFSKSTIIKWRKAYRLGKNRTGLYTFEGFLDRLRKWGFETADEALVEFREMLPIFAGMHHSLR